MALTTWLFLCLPKHVYLCHSLPVSVLFIPLFIHSAFLRLCVGDHDQWAPFLAHTALSTEEYR